ncbi:HTH domain-containing protein [Aerococcus agrisoli]|uniref:HTH domain-containing protein n=1 Tax=Aerococcus agrisoli TaxID=2487350 RepID=A0A3N4GH53_9LACT|nr:HTH domain-containing protein [Aerococcus agrisoli]RPA60757.1 HTH domain-containing protein [Aerococcus agrisoli]
MALVERWYKILNLFETSPTISQDEMTEYLGISPQTIKSNISLLNNELVHIASIEYENKFYTLKIFNLVEYEKILSGRLKIDSDFNSSKKRFAYILKRLIDSSYTVQLMDLADEMNVSRNTVANDIKEIRSLLQDYQVELIGKTSKGLSLKGNELEIRLIYVHFILDYYAIDSLIPGINDQLNDLLAAFDITDRIQNLLKRSITVTLSRIHEQHILDREIDYYYFKDSDLLDELTGEIELAFQLSISQYEKAFMAFPLNLYNQGINRNLNVAYVKDIFDKMMQRLQDTFAVNIDSNLLYDEMFQHLVFLINRVIFRPKTNDLLLKDIHIKYPVSYAMAEICCDEISKAIGRPVVKEEVNYLTLYLEMLVNNRSKDDYKEIAVICHTGLGTALLLKQRLQQVLGDEIHITNFSEADYSKEDFSTYFAIFTTIPLRHLQTDVPVIQILPTFDALEIKQEWDRIEKQQLRREGDVRISHIALQANKSYETQLNVMAKTLEKANRVDAGFAQRIQEREQLQSTVFGKGISMPHASNSGSSKIEIIMGTFEEAIQTENGPVELVMMLAVPDEMNDKKIDTLLEIYDFIFSATDSVELKEKVYAWQQAGTSMIQEDEGVE